MLQGNNSWFLPNTRKSCMWFNFQQYISSTDIAKACIDDRYRKFSKKRVVFYSLDTINNGTENNGFYFIYFCIFSIKIIAKLMVCKFAIIG